MTKQSGKKNGSHARSSRVQVTFRVDPAWLRLADQLAKDLSSRGVKLTRTDGFREAMARGFEVYQKEKQ